MEIIKTIASDNAEKKCRNCGYQEIRKEDYYEIDGHLYCGNCFCYCACCSEPHPVSVSFYTVTGNGQSDSREYSVCDKCLHNEYLICKVCKTPTHKELFADTGKGRICQNCR